MTSAPATPRHAVVALSGGVDSSVSAWLLLQQGWQVEAVFMKNWEEDDRAGYCAAAEDLADAEAVCRRLDIELRTVNLATEYWDSVFTRCLSQYAAGRTPNPDVLCNRAIKFDVFLDFALDGGAARLATGHYAQLGRQGDRARLLKARDPHKDQTYFLHTLDQAQLGRSVFPVGGLTKTEVRALAARAGLPTSEKKDSTGICFIGERPFKRFLSAYLPQQPGPIVDLAGNVVGVHDGLAFYTPGQRQGLGIGGRPEGSGEPWYVVGKDLATNTLRAVQGRKHAALYADAVTTSTAHWIAGEPPALPLRCGAKLRHGQPEQRCGVRSLSDDGLEVVFDNPQWAPAPGQSVVFYDEQACLGGAIIETARTRALEAAPHPSLALQTT